MLFDEKFFQSLGMRECEISENGMILGDKRNWI
jgi:hypothetical protein